MSCHCVQVSAHLLRYLPVVGGCCKALCPEGFRQASASAHGHLQDRFQCSPIARKCLSLCCDIFPLCTGVSAHGAIFFHRAQMFKHMVQYFPIVHRCLSTWCNISHCAQVLKHMAQYLPIVHRCLGTWCNIVPLCTNV